MSTTNRPPLPSTTMLSAQKSPWTRPRSSRSGRLALAARCSLAATDAVSAPAATSSCKCAPMLSAYQLPAGICAGRSVGRSAIQWIRPSSAPAARACSAETAAGLSGVPSIHCSSATRPRLTSTREKGSAASRGDSATAEDIAAAVLYRRALNCRPSVNSRWKLALRCRSETRRVSSRADCTSPASIFTSSSRSSPNQVTSATCRSSPISCPCTAPLTATSRNIIPRGRRRPLALI